MIFQAYAIVDKEIMVVLEKNARATDVTMIGTSWSNIITCATFLRPKLLQVLHRLTAITQQLLHVTRDSFKTKVILLAIKGFNH